MWFGVLYKPEPFEQGKAKFVRNKLNYSEQDSDYIKLEL